MRTQDAIVVGGGLAGLTAALRLARAGRRVRLIEREPGARPKVCGEYVSNEVVPELEELGVPVRVWQPDVVRRFRLHAPSGRRVECALPLGGFGMRRETLEGGMLELARERGVELELGTTVEDVCRADDGTLEVRARGGASWRAAVVLGATGKRSRLDRRFARAFLDRPAPRAGIKFELLAPFPADLVALYGFDGGYAGAVRVEDDSVNVALLVTEARLRRHGGLAGFEREVLWGNPALEALLRSGDRVRERPLAISNVSFAPRGQVDEHVLMVGDAAGTIFPLCGNGMAMAVHGARLACAAATEFLDGRVDRAGMERLYTRDWRAAFARRQAWGRRLHPLLERGTLTEFAVSALRLAPVLLPPLVRRTHGPVPA
ncbi:MAG TPA: NAD(P)/FAD-dependent oxidoreductase [Planctomycetota bacterium]|nr:NAD(P)/FAD-dependent oxidoreductase [Planctomycetota bacterium]